MNISSPSVRWYRNTALITLGLLVATGAAFFHWRTARLNEEFRKSDEAEAVVRENCRKAIDDFFVRHEISPEQFVAAMQAYVLAPWRELEAEQRKLRDRQPSALLDRRLEAMKLREQAWALIVDSVKQGSAEGMANAARKNAEADRIETEIAASLQAASAK
jgi:hypothetical protein